MGWKRKVDDCGKEYLRLILTVDIGYLGEGFCIKNGARKDMFLNNLRISRDSYPNVTT